MQKPNIRGGECIPNNDSETKIELQNSGVYFM
jgi:hypothetical protein